MHSIFRIPRTRPLRRAPVILSCFMAFGFGISVGAPDSDLERSLQEGSQLERSLASGESHGYTLL